MSRAQDAQERLAWIALQQQRADMAMSSYVQNVRYIAGAGRAGATRYDGWSAK